MSSSRANGHPNGPPAPYIATLHCLRIDRIHLTRFRNFSNQRAEFSPGVNLIQGDNGQGKTNLLEALHFLCLGHSQRTRKDRELIQWGADAFVLRLEGMAGEHVQAQSVEYRVSGEKRVKVDETESQRLSELLGRFALVAFTPEDIEIVAGAPLHRRRFLDTLLCQHSRAYLEDLKRYNHALKQRNVLLRQPGRFDPKLLDIFGEQLVETGSRLLLERKLLLSELAPEAGAFYRTIGQGREALEIRLQCCCPEAETLEAIAAVFSRKLAETKRSEQEMGTTLIGPHRDDLLFLLTDKPVREFGSQGQKRSVALSLKLAAARLLERKNRMPPILLMDDVFAELDESRRLQLSAAMASASQVFIANPRRADLPFSVDRTLHVSAGEIG